MDYFKQCRSLQEVRQRYKELALQHHPDRGGDNATMQQINLQYEKIMTNPFFSYSSQSEGEKEAFIKFPEIINKIINLNLIIEICGNWIWLSGNTYAYKDQLKEFGFYFASQKRVWYWRPREYRSNNRDPLPMDQIRSLYGSDIIENESSSRILERREL